MFPAVRLIKITRIDPMIGKLIKTARRVSWFFFLYRSFFCGTSVPKRLLVRLFRANVMFCFFGQRSCNLAGSSSDCRTPRWFGPFYCSFSFRFNMKWKINSLNFFISWEKNRGNETSMVFHSFCLVFLAFSLRIILQFELSQHYHPWKSVFRKRGGPGLSNYSKREEEGT